MSRAFKILLMATALLSGSLVMVIEVMGSRVVGPFFGVSLFVWTSLISVTLLALAAGYAVGGQMADRWRSPDILYLIIMAAGILTLLVSHLKDGVLEMSVPLGLRSGAFVSTLILFGPALFLLGCVTPYLVKLATRELQNVARTVGGLYALSTAGSVLGTVLTGFVLVAHLGVDEIFFVIGLTMVSLSVVYFLFFGRKAFSLLCAPLVVGMMAESIEVNSLVLESGTRATLVAERQTFYGDLRVIDYTYAGRHTRELTIDGLIQGGVDMRNGLSIYEHAYFLQFVPYGVNAKGKSCLVLGLGPGLIPPWYERHGVRTDVVEIDPDIVALAREHFGFHHTGDLVIADARYFLGATRKKYDYVVSDVFTGDTTPTHLLSWEAFTAVKRRMNKDGVFAINIAASYKDESQMTASVIRTLNDVFDQVDVYPAFDTARNDVGNFVLVAYDGNPRMINRRLIGSEPVHPDAIEIVRRNIVNPLDHQGGGGILLTDNYNPIDVYDAGVRETVRRKVLSGTDWQFLH